MARLTTAQVEEINRRYVRQKGVGALAKEFGIHPSTVRRIGIGLSPRYDASNVVSPLAERAEAVARIAGSTIEAAVAAAVERRAKAAVKRAAEIERAAGGPLFCDTKGAER